MRDVKYCDIREWTKDDAFDDGQGGRDRHHSKDHRQGRELGFVVGSDVTVVNEIAGNLIVQVKESRLALDKTMANRILIG